MNCPTIDDLSKYTEQLLREEEHALIQNHVHSCEGCMRVVDAFMEEKRFIKETLKTPVLPNEFAHLVLDQLEPYKQPTQKRRKVRKPVMLSAAAAILALGMSAAFNPGFAEWIGGFFSTGEVDEGLRLADEAGYTEQVNVEATDNGITFKVAEVLADSSRIALSYQILKGGKPQDTKIEIADSKNKFLAFDQNGREIAEMGTGWWEGSDYGLIEFSLREHGALEKVTVKVELVEINGKEGSWQLEIPIDMTAAMSSTERISLKDAHTDRHGVAVTMKEVRYAPSSSDLLYETSFTKEEQAKVKEEIQRLGQKLGKHNVGSLASNGTAVAYHIENDEGKVLYHNNGQKYSFKLEDSGGLQSSGREAGGVGHMAWNDSFIPLKDRQNLTFVLDGVLKKVPSDFSVKVNMKELKKNPLSFEYEGNHLTIKKVKTKNDYSLRKSVVPVERETNLVIVMEGGREEHASELGSWVLVDDKGKAVPLFGSQSLLNEKDEKGRYIMKAELRTDQQMEDIPEEFTLYLTDVTRYYEVKDKWKVPLY